MRFSLGILLSILGLATVSGAKPDEAFQPPVPEFTSDWDWIQTTSGEWLKGEIIGLYNRELEFDSDKFDVVVIDLDDISQLRSGGRMSVNIERRSPVAGQVVVDGGIARIIGPEKTTEVAMDQIVSISSGSEREIDRWQIKIGFGANLRSGNTDQTDFSTRLTLDRRTALSRFSFDARGDKSETNGIETADTVRIDTFADWFFSTRWFYRVLQFNYFRDPFQNVSHRYTIGTAVGYGIIDTAPVKWGILVGPGYQYNVVEDDENADSTGSVVGIIGSELEWEINKYQDFTGRYQLIFTDEDAGGRIYNLSLTLENEIFEDLDIDISFIWDRINDPLPSNDGSRPDPDDYRLILSVGYSI